MSGRQKGFTLIELLVVISIIGVLSTIAMTSLNGARIKAKQARIETNFDNFSKAVIVGEQEQNKTLMQITGSGCTRCSGSCTGRDLRNVSTTDSCYTAWASALSKIEAASSGAISGLLTVMARDPWGSPYILDENEGESSSSPCRLDAFSSAGPDGMVSTADDIDFTLPFFLCS